VPRQSRGGEATGMSGAPSAWSRSERVAAVLEGRRHLGQQVMEYLLIEGQEVSTTEAEEAFATIARELIAPVFPKT
jgi:hypothetical protein